MQIDDRMDNAIRESIINDTGAIAFENTFTPVSPHGANLTQHTVVAQQADLIQTKNFKQIFTDTSDFS